MLTRIQELAIPPAWEDVWICPYRWAHPGDRVDAAGRKQYRYHDKWRERRDAEKFEEMLDFARSCRAAVLTRHPNGDAFGGQRRKRQRLAGRPVERFFATRHFGPNRQKFLNLGVRMKILGIRVWASSSLESRSIGTPVGSSGTPASGPPLYPLQTPVNACAFAT